MMWAGIWKEGRTPLIVMIRDPEAPNQGYSSWSYIQALEEGLLPLYDGTLRFQQDNARIHTSETVDSFVARNAIELLEWPKNSPDLNPIEHVWAILKRTLRQLFPQIRQLRNNIADMIEFKRCIQIAWNSIPQDQIAALIASIPRRLQAVIQARGWYTRY